jgi:hypothetical protein
MNTRGGRRCQQARSDLGALIRKFRTGTLKCALQGAGVCTAYPCSLNGRFRRHVVAQTSRELLDRLRAIEMSQ